MSDCPACGKARVDHDRERAHWLLAIREAARGAGVDPGATTGVDTLRRLVDRVVALQEVALRLARGRALWR